MRLKNITTFSNKQSEFHLQMGNQMLESGAAYGLFTLCGANFNLGILVGISFVLESFKVVLEFA